MRRLGSPWEGSAERILVPPHAPLAVVLQRGGYHQPLLRGVLGALQCGFRPRVADARRVGAMPKPTSACGWPRRDGVRGKPWPRACGVAALGRSASRWLHCCVVSGSVFDGA
jgi:hypothetical protein